jgi:hypothetical protein
MYVVSVWYSGTGTYRVVVHPANIAATTNNAAAISKKRIP